MARNTVHRFRDSLKTTTPLSPLKAPQARGPIPAPSAPPIPEIPPKSPENPAPQPDPPTSGPAAAKAPDPAGELSDSTGPGSTSASVEDLASVIGEINVNEPLGTPGAAGTVTAEAVLSKDQFHDAFVMIHQFAGGAGEMVTQNKGWSYLAIQDRERPAARQASDALYRLAELYPGALGFLLRPGSEAMVCVFALGSYGLTKGMAVRKAVVHYAPKPAAPPVMADAAPLGTPQTPGV